MDNDDNATEPHASGIFHLCKPTASEHGESADLTVEAEDVSPNNSGRYRLTVTVDTNVWRCEGWGDQEQPERLARVVMGADSARNLARQLTKVAAKVDQSNGVHTSSRDDLGAFLQSLKADEAIYVEYDEADSVYRWGDLKSILY